MAEKVKKVGITKEKGYLYYLDKNGHISCSKMARGNQEGGNARVIEETGVTREKGFLYFIDKDGDVAKSPMARKK